MAEAESMDRDYLLGAVDNIQGCFASSDEGSKLLAKLRKACRITLDKMEGAERKHEAAARDYQDRLDAAAQKHEATARELQAKLDAAAQKHEATVQKHEVAARELQAKLDAAAQKHEATVQKHEETVQKHEATAQAKLDAAAQKHNEKESALQASLNAAVQEYKLTTDKLEVDLRALLAAKEKNSALSRRFQDIAQKLSQARDAIVSHSGTAMTRTTLRTLVPPQSECDLNRLVKIGKLKRPLKVTTSEDSASKAVIFGGESYEVWNAEWGRKPGVSEERVQNSAQVVAKLLNLDRKPGSLFWDLSIQGRATLAGLRPDGHGRMYADKSYQKSIPHQAVIIEFKTQTALASQGFGQALVYCHKLLFLDSTRQHVFAFVTDLDTCLLLKVKREFVEEVANMKVEQGTVQVATFSWYAKAADELTGLKVLKALAALTSSELGMAALHHFQQPVELLRGLGSGSCADVYLMKSTNANDPEEPISEVVLKIGKPFGADQLENEKAVLQALFKLLAPEQYRTRSGARHTPDAGAASDEVTISEMAEHIPQLWKALEMAKVKVKHLTLRPEAMHALYLNLEPKHVRELFALLAWLHRNGWFHCDLSYHNIMLAKEGWRSQKSHQAAEKTLELEGLETVPTRKTVVFLVDWGLAAQKGNPILATARGTPFTMSQKTLACFIGETAPRVVHELFLAQRALPYVYTEADELEAAAKTVLLVLSPALKRSLKRELEIASSNSRRYGTKSSASLYVLWECWYKLLPAKLLHLCATHDYGGVAKWLLSNDRLLLWDESAATVGAPSAADDDA